MAPPQKRKESEAGVQIYEASLNALSSANLRNYIDAQDPTDLLEESLKLEEKLIDSEEKLNKEFFQLVENLFQSITTKGLFTYEIYDYIVNKIVEIANTSKTASKIDIAKAYGGLVGNYISVFHKDYYLDELARKKFALDGAANNLKTVASKAVLSSLFHISSDEASVPSSRYGSINYGRRLSTDKKENLSNVASYLNIGKEKKQKAVSLAESLKEIDVNQNITNPSKQDPSMSIILLNDDNIRCGTKNALELSAFFNSISSLELSKAFPYFNATFVLPNTSKQDATNIFKTATLNQFMFGSRNENITDNYKSFEGVIQKDEKRIGVETNLAIFSTPQTVVNMNEKTGHRDIYDEDDKKLRITSIHDRARPFMTFKSFEIDIAPTTGLMSFKSGRISLVLHDRTRMADIAPFIKPDLFGAFGAEICVEYGWQHGDAGKLNSDGNAINPIGDFLNSSVCLEKYMITNSQFSVTNSGEVEINLSIAMKGPVDIRQTEIVEHTRLTIDRNIFNQANQDYILKVQSIQDKLKFKSTTPAAFNVNISNAVRAYNGTFSGKYVKTKGIDKKGKSFTKKQFRNINTLISNLNTAAKIFKTATLKDKTITLIGNKSNLTKLRRASGLGGLITPGANGNSFTIKMPNESTADASDFKALGRSITSIASAISKIKRTNEKIKDQIDNYVHNLIGGLQNTDLLYDKKMDEGYHKYSQLINFKYEKTKYITFGSFLSSLVGSHMTSLKKYDEIQIIFHNVNDRAGFCSNFGDSKSDLSLSLASLLINEELLEQYLVDLFEKNIRVTVESLISQVISNFILTKDNPCYGMQDFFERKDFKSPVKPRKKKKSDKIELSTSMTNRLNAFYYGTEEADTASYDDEGVFIPPAIQLSFDALSDVIDLDKTICRITVYDRNDNPYQAISNCFNQTEDINYNGLKQLLRLSRKTKNFDEDLKKLEKRLKKESATGIGPKARKLIKLIKKLKEKQVKNQKLSEKILESLLGPEGIIESFKVDGRTMFKFKSGKGFLDIKEKTRTLMPTATFASEHTALINASAATVNEANLNTVYITNQNRNNTPELNNNVIVDMPLRILPSQASIETFGCPWAGFGQYIFIDFETGTTLDNSYAITSVKHTLMPGNFKTTLALSYGDVYGKYEGLADGFNRLVASKSSLIEDTIEKIAQQEASAREIAAEQTEKEQSAVTAMSEQDTTFKTTRETTSENEPVQSTETLTEEQSTELSGSKTAKASVKEESTIKPEQMQRQERVSHKKQAKAIAKSKSKISDREESKIAIKSGFVRQLTAQNIFKFASTMPDALDFYNSYNVVTHVGKAKEETIFKIDSRTRFSITDEIQKLNDEAKATQTREEKAIKNIYPVEYIRRVGIDSLNLYKKALIISPAFSESYKKLEEYFKQQIILSILFSPNSKQTESIKLLESTAKASAFLMDPTIFLNIHYNPRIESHMFKSQILHLYSRPLSLPIFDYFEKVVEFKEKIANMSFEGSNLSSIIPESMMRTNDFYNMFGLVVKNKTLNEEVMYYITINNAGIILNLEAKFNVKDVDSDVNLSIKNLEYQEFVDNEVQKITGKDYINFKSISANNIYSDMFVINSADRESDSIEDIKSFFGFDTFEYDILLTNLFDNNAVQVMTYESSDQRLSKEDITEAINLKLSEDFSRFCFLLYVLNLEKAKYVNSIKNAKTIDDYFFPGTSSKLKLSNGSEDIVATYLTDWTRSLKIGGGFYEQSYKIESSKSKYFDFGILGKPHEVEVELKKLLKDFDIDPDEYIKNEKLWSDSTYGEEGDFGLVTRGRNALDVYYTATLFNKFILPQKDPTSIKIAYENLKLKLFKVYQDYEDSLKTEFYIYYTYIQISYGHTDTGYLEFRDQNKSPEEFLREYLLPERNEAADTTIGENEVEYYEEPGTEDDIY